MKQSVYLSNYNSVFEGKHSIIYKIWQHNLIQIINGKQSKIFNIALPININYKYLYKIQIHQQYQKFYIQYLLIYINKQLFYPNPQINKQSFDFIIQFNQLQYFMLTSNANLPYKQLCAGCFQFVILVALIYTCYITSGLFHQKILKHQYLNTTTGKTDYFQYPIVFTLFPPFFATIIGFVFSLFEKSKSSSQNPCQQRKGIPWYKAGLCGFIVNFNMWTYNQAIVESSFPAAVMVKSCSLLSVILVGVFCSRVKDKSLKLKSNKIIIGIFACIGIFTFNYFQKSSKDSADQAITLLAAVYLAASLIGDGFLPDIQAQIKSTYKSSGMQMYFQVNKYTFTIALLYVIGSGKLFGLIDFFISHQQVTLDVALLSILNAVGQSIIFQMIKLYKQHIPAFVIGIRKCLTVVVNIIYFGHSVNSQQFIAIIFVFCSILWETYDNYQQKLQQQKQKSVSLSAVRQQLEVQPFNLTGRSTSPTQLDIQESNNSNKWYNINRKMTRL